MNLFVINFVIILETNGKKVDNMYCDRFEELFIQETHNELLVHIQSCETCLNEYKKMLKTESLIKEVRPIILEQRRSKSFAKIAASLLLAAISTFVIFNSLYVPKLCYDDSVPSHFPVDEYGLLDIQ